MLMLCAGCGAVYLRIYNLINFVNIYILLEIILYTLYLIKKYTD